jgi:hypothetical protein
LSGHLIGCAGALEKIQIKTEIGEVIKIDLPTSHKLALLAFADSGDDRTHIGFPGEEGVMKWAVCSRGRAYELIRDLVTWELLKPHKRGRRGQRAEYVVFPNGCCDLHRPAVEEETSVDVEQLAAAAGVSVDQARKMLAAMGASGADVPAPVDAPDEVGKGSDASDAMSGTVSGASDANWADEQPKAPEPVDNPGKGPDSVHPPRSNADAFTPSKESPNPAGKPAGSCAAHPNGHANCRDCGTSPRARREAAKRDRAAALRAAEAARREHERQLAAATSTPPEVAAAAVAQLHQLVRPTRTSSKTRSRRA